MGDEKPRRGGAKHAHVRDVFATRAAFWAAAAAGGVGAPGAEAADEIDGIEP